MLLELGKATSFILCIFSLYSVLISAFLEPNTSWQQRMIAGLFRLAIAAGISLASGLLFAFPARTNPDRNIPISRTLPVQLFLWASFILTTLFVLAWYLRCGGQNSFGIKFDCF